MLAETGPEGWLVSRMPYTGRLVNEPDYVPQVPPRRWVVSQTGHFWQVPLPETSKACKQCGEVRTASKRFRAIIGFYTVRYFVCMHPQHPPETTKARPQLCTGAAPPPPSHDAR